MALRFEELAWAATPIGEISLRRRREPQLQVDVHEVLLGDEYLMSSLFTVAEVALADLGLAAVEGGELDVVVGGLGLGCTARAALADDRVRSLRVVEALAPVVDWHVQGLVPGGQVLAQDARCTFVVDDFFAVVASGRPFGPGAPERCSAVLLDVDHSPRQVLHPSHAAFYSAAGLTRLAARLHPGGVFALWSDEAPDAPFLEVLRAVFASAEAVVVPFANPLTGGAAANTVYVARVA